MFNGMDKKTKASCFKFLFACYLLYTISICIKMAYSAQMAEIILAIGSTKPKVSMGLLFYYTAYCVSQLLFAFIISKVNLKWFLSITVFLTAIDFGLVFFVNKLWQTYLILALGGVLQTPVWGGIMFFVGKYIPKEMSAFSSKFLTTGLVIGTAMTYGASALFVAIGSWKYTFLFFAVVMALSMVIFFLALKSTEKNLAHVAAEKAEEQKAALLTTVNTRMEKANKKQGIVFLVIFFTAVCALFACVYYAFMGWFPSLLIENFQMPSEYSILLTLLLPLSMTPSSFVTINLSEKSKSDYNVSIFFSAITTSLMVVLALGYKVNILFTLVVAIALLFCIRGLMSLMAAYFPLKYSDRIESGKFSLILNAFSSLVAGIMPYISAFVLENAGWDIYFVVLIVLTAIPLAMLLAARISEKRTQKRREEV